MEENNILDSIKNNNSVDNNSFSVSDRLKADQQRSVDQQRSDQQATINLETNNDFKDNSNQQINNLNNFNEKDVQEEYIKSNLDPKKSKSFLIIIIIGIVILIIILLFIFSKNKVDQNIVDDQKVIVSGDLNLSLDANVQDDVNNDAVSNFENDINYYSDFELKDRYAVEFSVLESDDIINNFKTFIEINAVDSSLESFDYNVHYTYYNYNVGEYNEEAILISFLSILIANSYGPGLNKDFSDLVYDVYNDTNFSLKEGYDIYDFDVNNEFVSEISKDEFFKLNNKIFISLNDDSEEGFFEEAYMLDVTKNLLDLNKNFRNINYKSETIFANGEIVSLDFSYLGDYKKFKLNFCVAGVCTYVYNLDKEWITLDEYYDLSVNSGFQ
ncbi:MAG: hypothetical protein WCY27_00440 [archaeon]|jgi:hypothetical protein|nr:hypothetical protein [archaeon]MDD3085181.1 hypothetical protein [Candidatus ainarchaeum sp.]MDD4220815.1 hypothetical protein [Candidatus ainarchaeum sp.]MDD4662315.1 hypothetical protein [Candidatus ainarchaeum sp.]